MPQRLRFRRQSANQEVAIGSGQIAPDDRGIALATLADPAMFELLFSKYWGPILRYCSMRVAEPADAEDAAIRVMTNAYASLPSFAAGSGQFRSWLFTIAHNEAVNVYRAQARQRTAPLPESFDLVDPDPTPEQLALASDDRRTLWLLLEGLPQRSREVVELRLSGFVSQEIADILGISDGAVRQAQARALDQLRRVMVDGDPVREVGRV